MQIYKISGFIFGAIISLNCNGAFDKTKFMKSKVIIR